MEDHHLQQERDKTVIDIQKNWDHLANDFVYNFDSYCDWGWYWDWDWYWDCYYNDDHVVVVVVVEVVDNMENFDPDNDYDCSIFLIVHEKVAYARCDILDYDQLVHEEWRRKSLEAFCCEDPFLHDEGAID